MDYAGAPVPGNPSKDLPELLGVAWPVRPQQLGDAIRAYWFFGPPDKPRAVSGMDFVILDGGKARTLYAFLDTV